MPPWTILVWRVVIWLVDLAVWAAFQILAVAGITSFVSAVALTLFPWTSRHGRRLLMGLYNMTIAAAGGTMLAGYYLLPAVGLPVTATALLMAWPTIPAFVGMVMPLLVVHEFKEWRAEWARGERTTPWDITIPPMTAGDWVLVSILMAVIALCVGATVLPSLRGF